MAFWNRRKIEEMVTVPLKISGQEEECIDIHMKELPPVDDVISLLRDECATADLWHRVALLYYRSGKSDSFRQIADEGFHEKLAHHNSDCKESSVVPLLLSLGAYYYNSAAMNAVGDKSQTEKFLRKTANCYNRAHSFGIKGFEVEYYVGRAYSYLLNGEHEHAEKHFTFILSSLNSEFIPAIVGKALLSFSNKDYKTALNWFRQALRLYPNGPANVRVGIGHCFWKLNNREKAKLAYERAVELYPNDHNAVCALATYHLSQMKAEEVKTGVGLLAQAHHICPTHPPTLLFLADHYYYKKQFERSLRIALDVCAHANDDIRKRSAYLAGRCYQAKEDIKYAMHYYYQALSEPDVGFLLPYFGLAQSYLHFNDVAHSSDALAKLLVHQPKNFLAKKMLGFLECASEDVQKKERAQKHLRSVLEHDPDDVWARLSLATSLECVDDSQAKQNYIQAVAAMKKNNMEIEPETYNNLGCTFFRLGKYTEALQQFDLALEAHDVYIESGKKPRSWMTTLSFNRARTNEALHKYKIAETIYKEILKKHPSYFSCFVRLAIIYRDRNNLHEADAYFKEALQSCLENPDVWAYIGNLHLTQGETLPAQKKFSRILGMEAESLKRDSYSLIALGNVEVSKLFNCIYDTNTSVESQLRRMRGYMKQSLEYYHRVLKHEPNNTWAANGIGCVLAAKGLFMDAREVFSQVQESVHDFKDVWINMGHTFLEQEMFYNAIQMYEACSKRFSDNTDCKLLQFLAKAYYYKKQYQKAKIALLKCLRIAPYDRTIAFCLAKTLRKIGWKPFQAQSGSDGSPTDGENQIKLARRFFVALSQKQSNSSSLIAAAKAEAGHCNDLLKQTPHMKSRIDAERENEKRLKYKREKEVEDFKRKRRQEEVRQDMQKKEDEKNAIKRREAMKSTIEKVKNALELESIKETQKKKERRTQKKQIVHVCNDDDDDSNDEVYCSPKASPSLIDIKAKLSKDSGNEDGVCVEELGIHSPPPVQDNPELPKKARARAISPDITILPDCMRGKSVKIRKGKQKINKRLQDNGNGGRDESCEKKKKKKVRRIEDDDDDNDKLLPPKLSPITKIPDPDDSEDGNSEMPTLYRYDHYD